MRISIATRLSLGFIPALFSLLIAGWIFQDRLEELEADSRWVVHTLEVLQHLDTTSVSLADAKSHAAAFQLTLRPEYLQAFQEAAAASEQSVASLRQLTKDNAEQLRRLDELVPALKARYSHLAAAMDQSRLNEARVQQGVEINANAQLDPVGEHSVVPRIQAIKDAERALLDERRERQATTLRHSARAVLIVTGLSALLVILFAAATVHRITRPLLTLESGARRVGEGDYAHRFEHHNNDEIGRVAAVFNQMVEQIQTREAAVAEQTWIKSSLASFTPIFQGGQDLPTVCHDTLAQLATLLKAPCLVLYLRHDHDGAPALSRCATFAAAHAPPSLAAGEGLAGQCLVERRTLILDDLPSDYLKIESSLGSAVPRHVYVAPVFFESEVRAVLEIALLRPFTDTEHEFLDRLTDGLGLMLNALEAKRLTEEALTTQTALSDTLERQRQALEHGNEEMALQTEQLRASERLAREQQEELRLANEEQQQANVELRKLTNTLDLRAQQLAETSAFKSEFLANMSHELRTPLNSLLILSKLLAEDGENPLSTKQQQYARTIHESGNDLLQQINEILDMARIESGKVHIDAQDTEFGELVRLAEGAFRAVAQTRHVGFEIELDPAVGEQLRTDQGRVWQILKNLLSNAFKFTAEGTVGLHIRPPPVQPGQAPAIAFIVRDSGIGIPKDKQQQIFEAFQQGDAGIARRYGGTGLGLSISLKLAHLLGGSLQVESEPGQGSAFTLTLPVAGPPDDVADAQAQGPAHAQAQAQADAPAPHHAAPSPIAASARAARLAADAAAKLPAAAGPPASAPQARPEGSAPTTLVVSTADAPLQQHLDGLATRRQLALVQAPSHDSLVATCLQAKPVLVVLDASADSPVIWTALGHLKQDSRTRHIAVHVLCHPTQKQRALRLGAASYTLLPIESADVLIETINLRLERLTQPQRNVLVVEDDNTQRQAILDLIGNGDIKAQGVATGTEALERLAAGPFDCVVLDLGLPDIDGMALLSQLNEQLGTHCPPVIIYTARILPRDQEIELMKNAQALIVKGAHSPERLIDELTLLLSRWPSRLTPATRALIDRSRQLDPVLAGHKILVVDDDVRNIFAISAALETYGAQVIHAENGLDGIAQLQAQPDTSLVLMDVMMPDIDGLETIRRIRALADFTELPIIAVTAKAMAGDRDHCLAAGASDYLPKPVDMDHLRAMIRVWLAR